MHSKKNMDILTSWLVDHLVKPSQSLGNDSDSRTLEETSCLNIAELLEPFIRNTSSGRTSRAHFQATKDGTFLPSLGKWSTSGIVCAGECSMLSTLESPKEGVESSLSDVLEKTII